MKHLKLRASFGPSHISICFTTSTLGSKYSKDHPIGWNQVGAENPCSRCSGGERGFIVMPRSVSGELLSSPRFSFSTTSPDFWICGGVCQHRTGDAVDEHGYIEPGHNVPTGSR